MRRNSLWKKYINTRTLLESSKTCETLPKISRRDKKFEQKFNNPDLGAGRVWANREKCLKKIEETDGHFISSDSHERSGGNIQLNNDDPKRKGIIQK